MFNTSVATCFMKNSKGKWKAQGSKKIKRGNRGASYGKNTLFAGPSLDHGHWKGKKFTRKQRERQYQKNFPPERSVRDRGPKVTAVRDRKERSRGSPLNKEDRGTVGTGGEKLREHGSALRKRREKSGPKPELLSFTSQYRKVKKREGGIRQRVLVTLLKKKEDIPKKRYP